MANWKEVALVEDLSGFAQTDATNNAVPYGNAAGGFDYTDTGADKAILVCNASGDPNLVQMSGKVTISNTGVTSISNDAIGADEIDNNAVGLDALASATAGDILYWNSSGNPALLPVGSATQVLAVNSSANAVEWADAAGAATLNTTDIDTPSSAHGVLFQEAGAAGSAKTVHIDLDALSFNPLTNKLSCTTFVGPLEGTADIATTVATTLASDSTSYYFPMVDQATADTDESVRIGSYLSVATGNSAEESTITVAGNLVVSGETTTLNTSTLSVEDKTIVCGSGATAMSTNNLSGLVINGGSATDANNPRFIWSDNGGGAATTSTTLGWAIADHGGLASGGETNSSSTLYNIAPTLINQSGTPGTLAIGRGSMYLTHSGTEGVGSKLYIQVD